MTSAARLNLRVFIDGYEIPVISAQCVFPDRGIAQANIQVIATDALYNIEPRAFVSVFYLHSGQEGMGFNNEDKLNIRDPRMYKAMFLGEYVGVRFGKTQGKRSAVITAYDFTNYWDVMKQHGTNHKRGGIEQIENAFLGVNMGTSHSNTATAKDLKSNIINWISNSKVGGKINLAKGLQRTIREMFFAGNIFYSTAFNRHRMDDMIVGLPDDTSSSKLIEMKVFKKYLDQRVAAGGNHISVRQILAALMRPMMYSNVTIPCPKFDRSQTMHGFPSADRDKTNLGDGIIDRGTPGTLNYILLKADTWFVAPPLCNMIFPDTYTSFSYQRSFLSEPTRLFLRTENLMKAKSYKIQPAKIAASGQILAAATYGTSWTKRLTDRLYAPDLKAIEVMMKNATAGGGYLARLHSVLMPHEEYVGPNVVFAWEGGIAQYVNKKTRRQYHSYIADYTFWKARLMSRKGTCSMSFNPNVVPGFQGVVFDKTGSHYRGYVTAVSHTMTQQGGATRVDFSGMMPNSEVAIQVDGEDQSYEELIMKKHFFDERYQEANVGEKFYQPLLGCDSIIDFQRDNNVHLTWGGIAGGGPMPDINMKNSVDVLFNAYSRAVSSGINPHTWINNVCHRPKATLVDLMGWDSENGEAWSQFPDTGTDEYLKSLSLDVPTTAPFFESSIDPDGEDTKQGEYISTRTIYGSKTVKEKVTVLAIDYRESSISISAFPTAPLNFTPEDQLPKIDLSYHKDVTKITKSSKNETVNYDLSTEVDSRQKEVKLYVDSLLYKGLKG